MCIKDRSPSMKHVARTHRVNLDWLFERLNRDPAVFVKFVGTKEQSADILIKGSFTAEAWLTLCNLCLIMPIVSFDPTAELTELKSLQPRISVALCKSSFANMFSKPAANKIVLGAAASAHGQQKSSSARPSWATDERRSQGRPITPEPAARNTEVPWAGDVHDAAWKEAAIKFCQDV